MSYPGLVLVQATVTMNAGKGGTLNLKFAGKLALPLEATQAVPVAWQSPCHCGSTMGTSAPLPVVVVPLQLEAARALWLSLCRLPEAEAASACAMMPVAQWHWQRGPSLARCHPDAVTAIQSMGPPTGTASLY